MSDPDLITADPFADPSVHSSQHDPAEDSTLEVGRNASLTLGTDSLIVLGEAYRLIPGSIDLNCG